MAHTSSINSFLSSNSTLHFTFHSPLHHISCRFIPLHIPRVHVKIKNNISTVHTFRQSCLSHASVYSDDTFSPLSPILSCKTTHLFYEIFIFGPYLSDIVLDGEINLASPVSLPFSVPPEAQVYEAINRKPAALVEHRHLSSSTTFEPAEDEDGYYVHIG